MPQFRTGRVLPHNPADLYAIAADVQFYPTFVPLCRSVRIWNVSTSEDGSSVFTARIDIAYSKLAITESFESEVTCDPTQLTVKSYSLKPPFRYLDSSWRFLPQRGGGTKVMIAIDYELKSRLLQILMNASFDLVMSRVIAAFEARAGELYGKQRIANSE
ncbi:MAG TPA: SRPBCC family protein [Aestuariivirgaceae bacterium]|jgi:coenzyme Q-binding protein COQ10|nr:SRPBCC family protein [Aestuariivirgaceae bacterium]